MSDRFIVPANTGDGTTPMIPWFKQKTSWTAIAAIITAAGAYFVGDISWVGLATAVFGALITIFGRQGIEKSKNPSLLINRGDADISG